MSRPPTTYYNWLEKVGGKGASLHFGAYNTHPDVDEDFKEIFKIWRKEWETAGVVPQQNRKAR